VPNSFSYLLKPSIRNASTPVSGDKGVMQFQQIANIPYGQGNRFLPAQALKRPAKGDESLQIGCVDFI
jgi:hypothetical protein